ncbi:MAG: low molecular weight phosphatase family protein [Cryobacterium sp.]|uniref:arsenate reductase/protein-tyrosine-phosphatase family protein n=1 Tax=unclassified Cryobacterium TaxID=2649013 RepID=UPI0018CA41A9|nr:MULTISPECIES: low molecular weight phosphatase family protein [unclassified Cryobacterium]MCY7404241.1 low molecular weight phosphatase family protein [Cryobacterium sp.]MEC5155064.1 protein-tyrosine phosphatase [Cryobacterium sp. CAN_C3]
MSVPRILLVCTGNICRSPLAEQLLRARLEALGLQADVQSAGTRAMVASPMTAEAAALSLTHGAHSTEHAARQLTEHLVGAADLILTATRDHRREVVTLLPKATRYTFTLNQFARLVGAIADPGGLENPAPNRPGPGPESGATIKQGPGVMGWAPRVDVPASAPRPQASAFSAFVASIAATRGLHPSPNPPTRDDIDDPYRQSAAVYTGVAAIIDESVTTIAAALAPALRQH